MHERRDEMMNFDICMKFECKNCRKRLECFKGDSGTVDIRRLKLKDIILTDYNPRRKLQKTDEAYKRIKASIEEFGYVDLMVVNTKNMHLVGGERRYDVLTDLNYKEADCVCVDLSDKQEKRLNLALNKVSGYWDNNKLEALFNELNLTEDELFATGFTASEIDNLSVDYISDLLQDDYSTVDRELDKFAVTFNILKEYQEQFSNYIKKHGKAYLVDMLIDTVQKEVI